jgi:hypothetical protein
MGIVKNGFENIASKRYSNHVGDYQKIKNRLPKYLEILDRMQISPNLAVTNINIITQLKNMLGIKTKLSMDYPTDLKSDDRLIDLCKYYECDTYLAGPSGKKYMDFNKWYKAGIKVKFFEATNKRHTLEVLCD